MPRKQKPEAVEPLISAHVETIGHSVLLDGRPCRLVNVSGLRKGGVLVPGAPLISFLKVRDAERAVERTQRVKSMLSDSLVSDWLRKKFPLLSRGKVFEVVAIVRQTEKPTAEEIGRAE